MGLAASQARLLTITARKADCEFQSMSLSHQKIALARDMEKISDEYQSALNKTKLVYDYYGSGLSQTNLDYNILMKPSVYNDYYPKVLTDNKDRLVLDSKYASAARSAGIPAEGYLGTPSSVIRNKFVEALADSGAISVSSAETIKSFTYNNGVGLGVEYSYTQATKDISYNELLELIKVNCVDTKDYGLYLDDQSYRLEQTQYPNYQYLTRGNARGFNVHYGGYGNNILNFSLYDLLNKKNTNNYSATENQYVLSMESGSKKQPLKELAFLQQFLAGNENSNSFLNWMTEQFSTILGGTTLNDQALQYAYDQVYDIIYPNENIQKAADGTYPYNRDATVVYMREMSTVEHKYKGTCTGKVQMANNVIGITSDESVHNGHRKDVAVNLNTLAKVFLTAFKEYLDGIDNSSFAYEKGMSIGNISTMEGKARLYNPDGDDIFTIPYNSSVDDGSENAIATFYDTLFNLICTKGWVENDKVATDSQYMQEMLKSGAIYISSINNDGNFYQNSYNVDTYISEIADSEEIAQAEAKYNAEKIKIENKENKIDVKMKNLDTEISSLTTEYDTVKSIISKSVEKSFKRYDA